MEMKSIGFIGSGRIARILLGGLEREGKVPPSIVPNDCACVPEPTSQKER
jgi:pyrroline-5-carboxylate reductase